MASTISTDFVLTPLTGKGRTLRRVADDVPPGGRRPRPVHQRRRVDPADRHPGADPFQPGRRARRLAAAGDRRRVPACSSARITNTLLTFPDPDRAAINGLGIERLPAFVHVAMDGTIEGKAEGWNPSEWQAIADNLAESHQLVHPRRPTTKATPARSIERLATDRPRRYLTMPPLVMAMTSRALSTSASVSRPRSSTTSLRVLFSLSDCLMTLAASS